MCKKTNYKIPNPRIDKCMAQVIHFLNFNGIKTLSCCCGHKKYPMTIIANTGMLMKPVEIFSGKFIPRKRNFYKRDEQGHYYIPETPQSNERICKCGHKQWDEHKSSFYEYKGLKMKAQECNVKGCKCKKFKLRKLEVNTKSEVSLFSSH